VGTRRIIVCTLLSNTVTSEWYVNETLELFYQKLRENIQNDTHSQQGNEPANNAENSVWAPWALLWKE
jgi:hypothetical protein